MNTLRRTVLLLLMLILPLQGVAGVSMSMCASDMGQHEQSEPTAAGMVCHHHGEMSMDMGEQTPQPDNAPAGDCPHCFALSHFIDRPAPSVVGQNPPSALIPFFGASFASLTLDQPLRPPVLA
ncbi:MAG: hypothetical protein AB1344_01320 [Pseudomonadota bacterium]